MKKGSSVLALATSRIFHANRCGICFLISLRGLGFDWAVVAEEGPGAARGSCLLGKYPPNCCCRSACPVFCKPMLYSKPNRLYLLQMSCKQRDLLYIKARVSCRDKVVVAGVASAE